MSRTAYHREWKRRKHGYAPRKIVEAATVQKIREMLSANVKQDAIAAECNVSQSYVSRIKLMLRRRES